VVVDHQRGVVLRNDAYVAIFAGDPLMVDTAGNPLPDEATPVQRAARRERFSMAFGLTGFGNTI
jgi:hypothetical protein